MSYQDDGGSPLVRYIISGAAVVFVAWSVFFMVQAETRLTDLENRQNTVIKDMARKLDDANGQTRASISVIADKVGITQKDLTKKASALQAQESATQTRLKADEESTKQQFTDVTGAVTKVNADVSDTRTDLAAAKGKLETALGDINKHSELIATNHDQLEELKHRGDRDYVEFTLYKGKKPTRLSTVGLQLKKVNPKRGEYTLLVIADDKRIEKKDRNLNEPLQFYTGRDRNLYEVVINAADKNAVSGYLSTPKSVAANVQPDPHAQAPAPQ